MVTICYTVFHLFRSNAAYGLIARLETGNWERTFPTCDERERCERLRAAWWMSKLGVEDKPKLRRLYHAVAQPVRRTWRQQSKRGKHKSHLDFPLVRLTPCSASLPDPFSLPPPSTVAASPFSAWPPPRMVVEQRHQQNIKSAEVWGSRRGRAIDGCSTAWIVAAIEIAVDGG
jgi:hypothetical protein